MRTFRNPVLPGFYPDPSAVRVGEDYYLVTSSFEYFPGVPIFHSKDLVHWKQIGHVLDRPSQLNLDGIAPSRGIWAPTIRYHNGVFYMITTLVDNDKECHNFYVTAADPAGDWSDPVWLEDAPGIDPSLFFDEDGKVYYTGNRVPPEGQLYPKHMDIWLQELDLASGKLTGPKKSIWQGALKVAHAQEGPNLYKIGDWYYLMIAEGGTGHTHAVTIARSAKVDGPYEGYKGNPILTHRHLGRRQQHMSFRAETAMHYIPEEEGDAVGIVLLQNANFQFRLEYGLFGGAAELRLTERRQGEETVLAAAPYAGDRLELKAEAHGQRYRFYWREAGVQVWEPLGGDADGTILSTDKAGDFTGAYMGMYAVCRSEGRAVYADFDWFSYEPIEERIEERMEERYGQEGTG